MFGYMGWNYCKIRVGSATKIDRNRGCNKLKNSSSVCARARLLPL